MIQSDNSKMAKNQYLSDCLYKLCKYLGLCKLLINSLSFWAVLGLPLLKVILYVKLVLYIILYSSADY